MRRIVIAVTALAVALPAFAAGKDSPRLVPVPGNPFEAEPTPGTARVMLALCEQPENSDSEFACTMYMTGLLDGTVADRVLNREPAFCVPNGQADVTPGLAKEIFKRWARSNPDYLDKDTGLAVLASLREAFPCRRSSIVR